MSHTYTCAALPAGTSSLRRRVSLVLVLLLLSIVATGLGPSVERAEAASYGWVYISAPTWQGNCPKGYSVVALWAMVGDTWSGGDAGDDLVYAKVRLNEWQDVVTQPTCKKGNDVRRGAPSSNSIRPTRTKQTWWVGPKGTRSN